MRSAPQRGIRLLTHLLIPVSPGELWDRITILETRMTYLSSDPVRYDTVKQQVRSLRDTWGDSPFSIRVTKNFTRLIRELRETNEHGWLLEDRIRQGWNQGDMEAAFRNNDVRNRLKREVDGEFDYDAADAKIHARLP